MADNIYWTLKCTIADGKLADLESVRDKMVATVDSSEPNTLNYEWWISDDKKSMTTYERFTDNAAALAHLGNAGPVIGEFLACLTIDEFTIYGPASDELRGAAGGLGPKYLSTFGGITR